MEDRLQAEPNRRPARNAEAVAGLELSLFELLEGLHLSASLHPDGVSPDDLERNPRWLALVLAVEVLCNERVVFLEIANVIRGLELNILKGVMQNREDNTWAHFIVEVNLDKVHLLYSLLYQPFRLTSLHCTVTGLERISEARHILAFDAASASNEKSHL
ncbi:Transcription factor bHLH157 [Linum perenne]